MGLSLWIPARFQFGEAATGQAHQGAKRQAVAEAIKRHLFPSEEAYAARLKAYLNALAGLSVSETKKVKPGDRLAKHYLYELWFAMFSREPGDIAADVAVDDEEENASIPDAFEASFCLGLHALCAECALHWVRTATPQETEEEAEADEASEAEEAEENAFLELSAAIGGAEGTHWAIYNDVRAAITRVLEQTAELRTWGEQYPEEEFTVEAAATPSLLAEVVLNALLEALSDSFKIEKHAPASPTSASFPIRYIVLNSERMGRAIERLVASLPFSFTVQPLRQPVAYQFDEPPPSRKSREDYFRLDLIGYRRKNRFLREVHEGITKKNHRHRAFDQYRKAVNLQQAVSWRINLELLHWARVLRHLARDEKDAALEGELDAGQKQDLRAWARTQLYRPVADGQRTAYEHAAEFLDSPLAQHALDELCRPGSCEEEGPTVWQQAFGAATTTDAAAAGAGTAFYLPWKADYRGRIYAETPWLTPQGGDLQRALFEFARGQPLDEHGIRALRRHGGNLVARSRLLSDLGIQGRDVVTLAEREHWVTAQAARILASARSPLTESFWREVSEKPMQFLAFCLAYAQWHETPEKPLHLPVQIDGTCNGLQHIAALTGDTPLAQAVNVLPRDDGLPGDIYNELASRAAAALGALPKHVKKTHRDGLEMARAWLSDSGRGQGWINRGTAKKTVMTIPYGAGAEAQARHVLEALAADIEQAWPQAPSDSALREWVAWKNENTTRRRFVAECTKGLLQRPAAKRTTGTLDDELKKELAWIEFDKRRTFAAYVSLVIVYHLRKALSEQYPAVDHFGDWLNKVANSCKGLPLLWLTPLGFPVCQDKFELRGTKMEVKMGAREPIRLDFRKLYDKVHIQGQRNALLPNLVHSLDATHLAKIFLAAANVGIKDFGSIHDCLLCHPNDADDLARIVRETFAELYRPATAEAPAGGSTGNEDRQTVPDRNGLPVSLAQWCDWMGLLVQLKNLRLVSPVLGALQSPGASEGERLLEADAQKGLHDAVAAVDLLHRIRATDESRQFLLGCLLEHLQAHEVENAKPQAMPAPPAQCALPIDNAGNISEYFFS